MFRLIGLHGIPRFPGLPDRASPGARQPEVRREGGEDPGRLGEPAQPVVPPRPAHILGGWMRFTPRFPKDPWEIMKIHDFSWKFNENPSKSMKNHGF